MNKPIIVLGNAPENLMNSLWNLDPIVYGCNYRFLDIFHKYEAIGMADREMIEFYLYTIYRDDIFSRKIEETPIYIPQFPDFEHIAKAAHSRVMNLGFHLKPLEAYFNINDTISPYYTTGASMISLALAHHPDREIWCVGFNKDYSGDHLRKLEQKKVDRMHEQLVELGYHDHPRIKFLK